MKELTAVTHDGIFHADDVVGAAILKKFGIKNITRSRKVEDLEAADIVFDVGEGALDHHGQAKYDAGRIDDTSVYHSAATLVAREYDLLNKESYPGLWYALVAVAARDNGQPLPEDIAANPATGAFAFVGSMLPAWTSEKSMDTAFFEAVEMAGKVLENIIDRDLAVQLGRAKVARALAEAYDNGHAEIVDLRTPGLTWQELLCPSDAKFVLFEDEGITFVQCVPPTAGSFEQKVPLPSEWAGLRGAALEEASGIKGAVFCHANKFICGFQTHEGAMEAAKKALEVAK